MKNMCATSPEFPPTDCTIKILTNGDESDTYIYLPLSATVDQLKFQASFLLSYPENSFQLFLNKKDVFVPIPEENLTLEEVGFLSEGENFLLTVWRRGPEDISTSTSIETEENEKQHRQLFSMMQDLQVQSSSCSPKAETSSSGCSNQSSDPEYSVLKAKYPLSAEYSRKSTSAAAERRLALTPAEGNSEADVSWLIDKSSRSILPKSTFDERNGWLSLTTASNQDASTSFDCKGSQETSEGPNYVLRKTFSRFSPDSGTGFVGLVNQAMTCYLNSFLQTLFMTPEFRNTLYRWQFDGTEDEGSKSIPYQLQRLFLQLQTSNKAAVGTTDLTTSFGWDSSEAWQQHDVQELCRVMFDALEQKFKNTSQADLISRLYEGKLKDYVKCLECGYESAREDTFLDVPLVVRPFGSSQAYSSVNEALQAFVTPETLQESNQYFCEQCNKKCDAHKGLKFIKFPYLLTLQLKRFDFDPVSMHRIKLNDKVSFPEILNLNDFIKPDNSPETCDDGDTTDSGSALDDEGIGYASGYKTGCSLSPEAFSDNDLPDDDEGIDVGPHGPIENNHELCINEQNLKKSMEKGPYVYELFSIMVHSGSASGGHYYAYIKCFKNGEWYCFNDAQVSRITYDDIIKTYGGGPSRGYYSSAYSSSSNAYMLMYRQINKEKNADCMTPEEFPDHIKALLQKMVDQEEQERLQKELERSTCKIKLFCYSPISNLRKEMKLKVHKDCSLAEATQTARSIMNLENTVPLDCCRLVQYDEYCETLEGSFDPDTEETFGELLGGVKSNYKFDLLLETKKPHEKFKEYKPGGVTIKLHVVDLEKEVVLKRHVFIQISLDSTVEDLRQLITEVLGINEDIRMVVMNPAPILLHDPCKTLESEGFHTKGEKLYIEYQTPDDAKKLFVESKLYRILESFQNTVCMSFILPEVDQATLDCLCLNCCDTMEYPDESSGEEDADNTGLESETCSQNSQLPGRTKATEQDQWSKPFKRNFYNSDDSEDSEPGSNSSSSAVFPRVVQTVHSDQSEDSSLTDSERTLVGDELSPRNNSPDIADPEMELDIDSGGAKPEDSEMGGIQWTFKMVRSDEEKVQKNRMGQRTDIHQKGIAKAKRSVSPAEDPEVVKEASLDPDPLTSDSHDFFSAYAYRDVETNEKMLTVYADQRMRFAKLKEKLALYVGVEPHCFKFYKIYSTGEVEYETAADNLSAFADEKLTIKIDRDLRKGEYIVSLNQLFLNEEIVIQKLMDCVVHKNMTVLSLKEKILPKLNIPLNRCRLRITYWLVHGKVLLDHQTLGSYLEPPSATSLALCVQELSGPDPITSSSQVLLFSKRWHPSTLSLDPFIEITVDSASDPKSLLKAVSEASQIPEEFIEFAVDRSYVHYSAKPYHIAKHATWDNQLKKVEDGDFVVYRDSREEIKELTRVERRRLLEECNDETSTRKDSSPIALPDSSNDKSVRHVKKKNYLSYSPRKEKALKFYTVDSNVSNVQSKSSQSSSQTTSAPRAIVSHQSFNQDSVCGINPELD